MSVNPTSAPIHGVLLDIEGTTTPISFVHDVLFPYSRIHLREYLAKHWDAEEMREDIAGLRAEHAVDVEQNLNPPPLVEDTEIGSVVAYVNWLIDRDRKSAALKNLQGKIWKEGYLTDRLKGELFEDVAPTLRIWRRLGLSINIFSSGSSLAQRLLFAHTQAGDLTGLIDNYFDTKVGTKIAVESYRQIARALQTSADKVLFVSDVVQELDAANAAGMNTALCVRAGNSAQGGGERHRIVHSLEEIRI